MKLGPITAKQQQTNSNKPHYETKTASVSAPRQHLAVIIAIILSSLIIMGCVVAHVDGCGMGSGKQQRCRRRQISSALHNGVRRKMRDDVRYLFKINYYGCGGVGWDDFTTSRRRGVNKNSMMAPRNTARQKAKRIIFIWAYAALSLSTEYCHIVEASSNGDSGGNAPFLVMSEITVQSDEGDHADANYSNILSRDDQNDGSADDTDVDGNSYDGDTNSNIDVNKGEQISADVGGVSSGSDTDEEDNGKLEENISMNNNASETNAAGGDIMGTSSESPPKTSADTDELATSTSETEAASASSQPLRTLKRLQAMLDDSDYATHTVASSASVIGSSTKTVGGEDVGTSQIIQTASASNSNTVPSPTEKLWTSKDRAKYRRTRRTEKQRQHAQQREYEELHARKIRDIQRQRIIREEKERKELEELRRKRAEVMERQQYEKQKRQQMQQQFLNFDEMTDFTDDDTDTDGKDFDLPNLPVYLSDAETDDFSEEADDSPKRQRPPRPVQPTNFYPPNPQQGYQTPPQNNMGQNRAPPYQYNYPEMQHNQQRQQQQQQQPPPQTNGPYQNYQQYTPNYTQQQQAMPHQYSNNQQQMQDNQRQYEQQYAAWAQATANGYYYPPPPPPPSTASFHGQEQNHQSQPPQSSYTPPHYPYTTQQQQDQRTAYTTHPQQPGYQIQQQGGPHSSAYSTLPPQHASFPPRPQTSHTTSAYQGSEQGLPIQQQQQNDSQNSNVGAMPYDVMPSMAESTTVDPFGTPQEVVATSNTTTASTAGQMAVKSAFVVPTPPLISPMPSRVAAPINAEGPYCELDDESGVLIPGAESKISFDSLQKLSFSTIGVALLSYCAVSPRSLPFPEYNRLFLQNLSIVWLAAVAPVASLLSVYDGKYNNINTAIGTFHVSFTLGYALAFLSEIIVTTAVRLGVFKIWEPAIFSLTPEVPSLILPWVLREKQYKPKRITLFAADFAASCVASPIIEEYLKLKIVQWTCKLPRNFKHSKKVQRSRRRRKQNTLQPVRNLDAPQVTDINCYVVAMLTASLGLKLADISRRILMYTKESDDFKRIYALLRGTFPLHELCGTMTALLLARRDVLGVNLPMWKILGPAVFIHGMANFRGMKPIFKWNSSTPWSEMQINRLMKGESVLTQLIPKSYGKLVWMTILFRVFGFCCKNYYLIGRQAMKRTTTYSGKLHAFDAKLHTDAMLKRGS